MPQVINAGGDTSMGLVMGVLIALVIAILAYFFVIRNDGGTGANGPEINISAPAVPATPGGD